MDIAEWFAAGKPLKPQCADIKCTRTSMQPPFGRVAVPCYCDPVKELAHVSSAREEWYKACPKCRAQTALVSSLPYSPSLGAFVGTGVTSPDAKQITATINPNPKPGITTTKVSTSSPQLPQGISNQPGANTMVSTRRTASLSGIGGIVGGTIGSIIPGIGTIGGGAIGSLLGGLGGASKCPGPYNYDPVTGGCVPKPGSLVASGTRQCPDPTTEYDPSTGMCKKKGFTGWLQQTLPGGQTGYVKPSTNGWTATTFAGVEGFVPQAVPQQRLRCPQGYVLYGKQAGQETCLPKGFLPNKHRKWPKSPNPALSAQDMKTLRRVNTLQKKIKRVAGTAGFTVKKR